MKYDDFYPVLATCGDQRSYIDDCAKQTGMTPEQFITHIAKTRGHLHDLQNMNYLILLNALQ